MGQYILFHLYGPIASWGDIAVGEQRPSFAHPSKSAIIGLIAAALGIRREEDEQHRRLAESLRFAVRIDASGELLRDYHTIQTPTSKKGVRHATRKSELSVAHDDLNTILSYREYRCDALYTVCLWQTVSDETYSPARIRDKLLAPDFVLYLGRKSCPPSLPFEPQIVEADSISEAFASAVFKTDVLLGSMSLKYPRQVYWEGDSESGFVKQMTITRRDQPISRRRWQFSNRTEHYTMLDERTEE